MRLQKFFKTFDSTMKQNRSVEIYNYEDCIYRGSIDKIPEEILEMTLELWCPMLDTHFTNGTVVDEDSESLSIRMFIFIRVSDRSKGD